MFGFDYKKTCSVMGECFSGGYASTTAARYWTEMKEQICIRERELLDAAEELSAIIQMYSDDEQHAETDVEKRVAQEGQIATKRCLRMLGQFSITGEAESPEKVQFVQQKEKAQNLALSVECGTISGAPIEEMIEDSSEDYD